MEKKFIIIVIAIIGFISLIFLLQPQSKNTNSQELIEENPPVDSSSQNEEPISNDTGYTAKSFTQKGIPYLDFNQSDYESALAENKIVYLEFYADWCPYCRLQQPDIVKALESIENPNMVAFRVNFKDDDTDENEKALAETYKIPYQHTKIILVDGKEVFRSGEIWSEAKATAALQNY